MAIFLTDKELVTYPMLKLENNTLNSGGTLYLQNNLVYKMLGQNYRERLEYLKNLPPHPNVLPIIDTIVPEFDSEYQSGYITEYKENAKTWFSCFGDNLEFKEKNKYIEETFSALKHLHQFIIIGDIHGDNIFIHNNKAYIFDLDYFHKLNKREKPFKSKYYVSKKEIKKPTIVTDVIKAYIESYSFIFEIDLSMYIRLIGYKKFCKLLLECTLPKEVLEFLKISLKILNRKQVNEEIYISNNFIKEDLLEKKDELVLKLKSI